MKKTPQLAFGLFHDLGEPRQFKCPPGRFPRTRLGSTELTPCHIEMSFASGIYSLKHFCLLVPVIVGVARKLLAEWGHRRICSKLYASAPGDRQGGFLAFALGGA